MNGTNQRIPKLAVWWLVWVGFQAGVFLMYFELKNPTARDAGFNGSSGWLVGYLPLLLSAVIRWLILPRIRSASLAYPCFVIGIAMAEMCLFLGLFLFPAHQHALFLASAAGVFQFIPVYASQFVGR